MKKSVQLLFALIFSVCVMHAAIADNTPLTKTKTSAAENLDGVVAVVNSAVVTRSELNTALTQAKKQMAASGNPNALDDNKLKQMVLQQLIDEKLQVELADRAKITVTDAEVDQSIKRIAESHHISVDQLKATLEKEGMSFKDYRKMIRKQLLVHQVEQSAVGNKIQVTPQDIKKAAAQYRAQVNGQQAYHLIDIVMSTQQQAQQVLAKLKSGANINKVAPNETKDLGWKTADNLPSLFLQQVTHMQTGDLAGPIQAPNGYHVIKLVGMQGQSAPALTEEQLKNIAYQMKFQEAVSDWMKTVRKTAYIKVTP